MEFKNRAYIALTHELLLEKLQMKGINFSIINAAWLPDDQKLRLTITSPDFPEVKEAALPRYVQMENDDNV